MRIYNEIIIDMNPESSSYGETLHEDSFEYEGPMALAIETGASSSMGEGGLLGRDLKAEQGTAGRQASTLAKAKSGGAGLGGLLGAVIGVALAPFTAGTSLAFLAAAPAVAAAIGGGLGALAGSKIGGATSGVSQTDILEGGKFMKQSRLGIADEIAASEFSDVAMAAASGYMQAGSITKGLGAFKTGAAAGGGLMGGIKGLGSAFIPGMKEATVGAAAEGALTGAKGSILDVVKGASMPGAGEFAIKPAASKVVGGIGKTMGGIGKTIGGAYQGIDKMLGGALPFGQPIGEGYLSKIPGLLGGGNEGQKEYSSQAMDLGAGGDDFNLGASMENAGVDFADLKIDMDSPSTSVPDFLAQHNANMLKDSATNLPMQSRIKMYMDKGWAPDDTIDMNLWKQISGIMGGR